MRAAIEFRGAQIPSDEVVDVSKRVLEPFFGHWAVKRANHHPNFVFYVGRNIVRAEAYIHTFKGPLGTTDGDDAATAIDAIAQHHEIDMAIFDLLNPRVGLHPEHDSMRFYLRRGGDGYVMDLSHSRSLKPWNMGSASQWKAEINHWYSDLEVVFATFEKPSLVKLLRP